MMNRRNSLGIPDETLQAYMQVLIDSFSLLWLEAKANHPIQLLWKRADVLATNELYALAHSIKTITAIDPKWTREQVKIAKTNVVNNYRGALLALVKSLVQMLHTE